VKDLEGESDVDEEFQLGLGEAAGKFAVKRKKKHMFNESGIPIEPFNLENDIKEGYLTREGVFKMEREKRQAESDEEQDAWYESIREQQSKMNFEKSQMQANSDASESEDEDGGSKDLEEGGAESGEEAKADKRVIQNEIIALKRELVEMLKSEGNENANMAL
jgi:hypothetical protein